MCILSIIIAYCWYELVITLVVIEYAYNICIQNIHTNYLTLISFKMKS